jgi:hypothetical protein
MGVVLALPHEIATLVNSYVFVKVFEDSHAQFVIISFYIIYTFHEQTNRPSVHPWNSWSYKPGFVNLKYRWCQLQGRGGF